MTSDTFVESHFHVIGLIALSSGFLAALVAKLLLVFAVIPALLEPLDPPGWVGDPFPLWLVSLAAVYALVFAVVSLAAGAGVLRQRSWSQRATTALAVVNIPLVPLGTLFAAYTLWVGRQPGATWYFEEPGSSSP